MKNKSKFSLALSALFIAILFVAAGVIANIYTIPITNFIEQHNTLGKVVFVSMAVLAIVVPVWSNLFLLPFGVVAWGPSVAALLCIIGWWFGSTISFAIARTYQHRLLLRYPSLAKYEYVDSLVSQQHEFFTLIFLRMTLPVDVLSYALGIFSTRITWKQNAIATLIGIIPFAFIFSYMGTFSTQLQIVTLALTMLLFIVYMVLSIIKK